MASISHPSQLFWSRTVIPVSIIPSFRRSASTLTTCANVMLTPFQRRISVASVDLCFDHLTA